MKFIPPGSTRPKGLYAAYIIFAYLICTPHNLSPIAYRSKSSQRAVRSLSQGISTSAIGLQVCCSQAELAGLLKAGAWIALDGCKWRPLSGAGPITPAGSELPSSSWHSAKGHLATLLALAEHRIHIHPSSISFLVSRFSFSFCPFFRQIPCQTHQDAQHNGISQR